MVLKDKSENIERGATVLAILCITADAGLCSSFSEINKDHATLNAMFPVAVCEKSKIFHTQHAVPSNDLLVLKQESIRWTEFSFDWRDN